MRKAIPTDSSPHGGPNIDAMHQSPIGSGVDSLQPFALNAPLLTQFNHYRKRVPLFILLCAVAVSLSACGWKWPEWANQDKDPLAFLGKNEPEATAPPPPDMIPKDAPDQNDPRSQLVPASTKGVNLETYFFQDIKDPITRIQRLENVILAMHKDMQNLNVIPINRQYDQNGNIYIAPPEPPPSLTSEIITESTPQSIAPDGTYIAPPVPVASPPLLPPLPRPDNGQVIRGGGPLEPRHSYQVSMDTGEPIPPPQQPQNSYQVPFETMEVAQAPLPHMSPPPSLSPPPSSYAPPPTFTGTGAITGMRVGAHPDKIRIVFDVTSKMPFKADLDNNEHLLLVEIPGASWQAPASVQSFGNTPLLGNFKAEPFNNGTRAVFQLKGNTSIIYQRILPALSGGGQRIIIDLSR